MEESGGEAACGGGVSSVCGYWRDIGSARLMGRGLGMRIRAGEEGRAGRERGRGWQTGCMENGRSRERGAPPWRVGGVRGALMDGYD